MSFTSGKQETETALEPMRQSIINVVNNAWNDWKECAKGKHFRYPRTQANVIFDRMIAHALTEFEDIPEIQFLEKHETAKFILGESLVLRFKKGNAKGISSNYPTQLSLSYNDPSSTLFGIGEEIKVDIVYILNDLNTEIIDIMIVRRNGDSYLWAFSIKKDIPDATPIPNKQQDNNKQPIITPSDDVAAKRLSEDNL